MIPVGRLLVIIVTTLTIATHSLSQSCEELTGTTRGADGISMFAFKETIDVISPKGTEGFVFYGFLSDSTIIFMTQVNGAGNCIDDGAKMYFEFTDGTLLKLQNIYTSNCERKSVIAFNKQLKTQDHLETFKTKNLESVKIWTSSSSVKLSIPPLQASKISNNIRCLSNYIGVTPPDTAKYLPVANPRNSRITSRDTTNQINPADSSKVFMVVEQQPEYEGGYEAMINFIKKNQRMPAAAKRAGLSGTVYVTFIVGKDGSVQDIKVLRGISKELDDEAVRVVSLMPKWKPGFQNGKPVFVRFNLPIKFKI